MKAGCTGHDLRTLESKCHPSCTKRDEYIEKYIYYFNLKLSIMKITKVNAPINILDNDEVDDNIVTFKHDVCNQPVDDVNSINTSLETAKNLLPPNMNHLEFIIAKKASENLSSHFYNA